MAQSLASRIEAANSELMVNGHLDAVGKFFATRLLLARKR
jgi:hypothetical protein